MYCLFFTRTYTIHVHVRTHIIVVYIVMLMCNVTRPSQLYKICYTQSRWRIKSAMLRAGSWQKRKRLRSCMGGLHTHLASVIRRVAGGHAARPCQAGIRPKACMKGGGGGRGGGGGEIVIPSNAHLLLKGNLRCKIEPL